MQLKFGDQPATIVTRVVRPPEDATKDGVLRNYEILPLTPFNGGTVEVQAALLAMQGAITWAGSSTCCRTSRRWSQRRWARCWPWPTRWPMAWNIMQATNGDARLPYHDTFVGAGMGANETQAGLPGPRAGRSLAS